eukprot:jgi/Galph1/3601/GphlegSOOS_G2261.1
MIPASVKHLVLPWGLLCLGSAISFYAIQQINLPVSASLEKLFHRRWSHSSSVTSTEKFVTEDEQGDCDCLPLWQCMIGENEDCSELEKELRLCMERKKVGYTLRSLAVSANSFVET